VSESSLPPPGRDTSLLPPASIEERLAALEEDNAQIRAEQTKQRRAIRYQAFDQDLLMNSLQYLVQRHAGEDDTFRDKILQAFMERNAQREEQRRLDAEEDQHVTRSGR
jgi:hypothetical protein